MGTHVYNSLNYLEYLNLYGTAISDSALVYFEHLPALKSVYLWQTNTTNEGVSRLREAVADLYVNTGLIILCQ